MRRLFRGSLPLRVFAVSVIVFAVPLVTYFLLVLRQSYSSQLQEIIAHLDSLGKSRAVILGRIRRVSGQALDIAARLMEVAHASDAERQEIFNVILSAVQEGAGLTGVFLVEREEGDRYFCTAASDPGLIGKEFTYFHFVHETLAKGALGILSYGEMELGRSLIVTQSIVSPEWQGPQAILVASQAIDQVIDELLSSEGLARPVEISLVTDENVIFASGDPGLVFRVLSYGDAEELSLKDSDVNLEGLQDTIIQAQRIQGGALELNWDNRMYIAVEVPVKEVGVSILLSADEKTAFQALYLQIFEAMTMFVTIFAVGGWISLWLTERMARPFASLRQTMRRVSEGDLEAKFVPQKMGFEINQLGAIFNDTLAALKSQMAAAQEERAQKERYIQELKIGTEIQRSLLPLGRAEFPGLEIAARYLPAREVGGDFYDAFVKREVDGSRLLLTVADAAGKGISACLYSLGLRSAIRTSSMSLPNVGAIMSQANDLFCHDTGDTGMFVTAFAALYDPKSRLLSYTLCGHTPALLRRQTGGVEVLSGEGLALGVLADQVIDEQRVELAVGDFLFLYTDGITEAHNEQKELFGQGRLHQYLERFDVTVTARGALESLLEEVQRFVGAEQQFDDITLLVVKVLEQET